MSHSDNRILNDKPTSGTSPRLSIRIPRNITKFGEGDLMSPRTTTVSHPSSSLKEVPRAALFFSDSPPLTSEFESPTMALTDDLVGMSEDDLNQGLKALADASLPTERISSPPEEIISELNEDEVLGKLFTTQFKEDLISQIYKDHCREEKISEARTKLNDLIEISDELLQSKSISMSLKNVFPLYIQRVIELEIGRTGKKDFTNLLMDDLFISASATVIIMLPRLISILFRIEDVSFSLKSNLFDVLLTIEQVLKAFPELLSLPETRKRLRQMEQILLEDAVWRDRNSENAESNTLYKLLKFEFKDLQVPNCPLAITSTLSGIRASQRALETLSGFTAGGSRLTRLELFFRKFLRLSAQRLQWATLRLGLSRSVTQLSWELFFDLVQREGNQEHEFLFKNRHLNQILMSTIYCASHLMEQERTFHQISQVLPRIQSNSSETEVEIYKFYNETFIVPLRKRIETFLLRRSDEGSSDNDVIDDSWILNGLFTTAPFPSNPQYQLSTNITLNRLNQPKSKSKQSFTKYEWLDPALNSNHTQNHIQNNNHIQMHTPSRTSQLLNYSTTEASSIGQKRFSNEITDFKEIKDNVQLKKIARKLDFTSEYEE